MTRQPFFTACPICGSTEAAPLVLFPQLVYGRCLACKLIYKREQLQGLGQDYDEDYFRHNRAQYLKRWSHRVRKCRRQILATWEYCPQGTSLLDVGCSAGYVLEAARTLGLRATGLDCSRFAVNVCRERGLAAEVGSANQMPFPGNSFDFVTMKHTLEHLRDPLGALKEIHRVLRPNGVAFLIVPDAAYYKVRLMPKIGRNFRPDRRGWQHHVYYYEKNLIEACNRAGLVVCKAGKDIFRRRLAVGIGNIFERLRWYTLWAWSRGANRLHVRREVQIIARKAESALGLDKGKVSEGIDAFETTLSGLVRGKAS